MTKSEERKPGQPKLEKVYFTHLPCSVVTRGAKFKYDEFFAEATRERYTYVTAAYRFVSNKEIQFGTSFCSPKDNWCKRIGRTIAAGRLESRPISLSIASVEGEYCELDDPNPVQLAMLKIAAYLEDTINSKPFGSCAGFPNSWQKLMVHV